MGGVEKRDAFAERLRARTGRGRRNECWPWLGARNGDGYGIVRGPDGKLTTAHRAAFVLAGGDASSPVVRHSCDNPGCVNPRHLLGGTALDNVADMVARGRAAAGVRNGSAKLNPRAAAKIRAHVAAGVTQRQVAAAFGVSQSTVSNVAAGLRWT